MAGTVGEIVSWFQTNFEKERKDPESTRNLELVVNDWSALEMVSGMVEQATTTKPRKGYLFYHFPQVPLDPSLEALAEFSDEKTLLFWSAFVNDVPGGSEVHDYLIWAPYRDWNHDTKIGSVKAVIATVEKNGGSEVILKLPYGCKYENWAHESRYIYSQLVPWSFNKVLNWQSHNLKPLLEEPS